MTRGRGGYAVPLALIGIGFAALLATLGVAPGLSWGALLALWPLLLVLLGIDLLLGPRMPVAAVALQIAVIAGGLALAASGRVAGPPFGLPIGDCPPRDAQREVRVDRNGADALELDLELGAGAFRLVGGTTALVEARADAPAISPAELSREGGRADVEIHACSATADAGEVIIAVASDLPLTLELSGGAGAFRLDLTDVRLAAADIQTGAASVVLRPPRPDGEVRIDIRTGASSIEIELPEGVEARVESRGALSSFDPPDGGAGPYETAGFASAEDRIRIVVSSGLSSVRVR